MSQGNCYANERPMRGLSEAYQSRGTTHCTRGRVKTPVGDLAPEESHWSNSKIWHDSNKYKNKSGNRITKCYFIKKIRSLNCIVKRSRKMFYGSTGSDGAVQTKLMNGRSRVQLGSRQCEKHCVTCYFSWNVSFHV